MLSETRRFDVHNNHTFHHLLTTKNHVLHTTFSINHCKMTEIVFPEFQQFLWSKNDLLFVLRGFEEGVFGGAADHLVEGCSRGDHGVDAVFFFYLEVDEERLA